ncbi:MAG TPA: DUF4235 domain-containing protein [Solirubrobacteraceae bacterium]|nr:DUF4235 domain-containing protein [Solirubrobacteraceae bacterium]
MKLVFAPIRIASSLLAGITGRRAVDRVWRLFDDGGPPKPEDRTVSWPRLVAALVLEGAILRLMAGVLDHASRSWFAALTGRWPGEQVDSVGKDAER